ncbi:hypothetical protein [Dyadobacter sp. CY312]|nr:hypothetical protein [Dyadobacter sp. CY312]MCE7040940.1 hypothetical protein [Dyadobacter sp. CY312]
MKITSENDDFGQVGSSAKIQVAFSFKAKLQFRRNVSMSVIEPNLN